MHVLVTGGTGYIGSIAVEIMRTQGFEVSILDDCSTGHADTVPVGVRFIAGSLLERTDLDQALDGVDAVLHFAGKSLVGESVEKPELYQRINVGGTRNLLDAMRSAHVMKMVFSSSAATYGEPKEIPIKESSATFPTNPYGATKLAIDHMIAAESKSNELAAVSLRYFNVAGALKTKQGWLSERHNPETHLIPNVLRSTPSNPVRIFGTDWQTPDGTCIRDYVHVVDLIEAHIKALDSLESFGHEIYNLGSGTGYSVKQVIAAAEKATGHEIPTIDSPRRDGDPAVLVADISRAKKFLNWEAKVGIEDIIKLMLVNEENT
jgi:UDP-glucose 4-epimerase